MLFDTPFSAGNVPTFPDKTLCLTFDDGPAEAATPPSEPGPHSVKLAQYLECMGVQATFFMVGRQAQLNPEIPARIAAMGHQVAVHTYDHMGLDDYLVQNGGDVVRQISMTAALLPHGAGPLYLRAPYGQWTPAVAQALNADLLTSIGCFGPIHWDNSATDWDKWLDDVAPEVVAREYMDNINAMGKGVILMHDNMANVRKSASKNRGLAFVERLVPLLLDAGYQLSRVDAIPGIASLAAAPPRVAFRGANQSYLTRAADGSLRVDAAAAGPTEQFTVVPLGGARVAFQSPDGHYISLSTDGVTVAATAPAITDWEIFEAVPCASSYIFRDFTGDFLRIGDAAALVGNGAQTDPNNRFTTTATAAAAAGAGT